MHSSNFRNVPLFLTSFIFVVFHVSIGVAANIPSQSMAKLDELKSLLDRNDPIVLQLTTDLLVHNGCFADALALLDSHGEENLTPYMQRMLQFCRQRQSGGEMESTSVTSSDPVTYANLIYRLLKSEKWNAAMKHVDILREQLEAHPHREVAALLYLYRGMILAESGVARFYECYPLYAEANRLLDEYVKEHPELESSLAEFRFRAANHCGDYLLRLTRYRISNHARTLGAGDETVLADVWFSWSMALDMYEKALRMVRNLSEDQTELTAMVRINLAQLYLLRSDIVQTFKREQMTQEQIIDSDSDVIPDANAMPDVIAIETLSFERAIELIELTLATNIQDDILKGTAHLILAGVARRRSDIPQCQAEANIAREHFVRAGKLSSVVTVEQMLANTTSGDFAKELRHLQISDCISEILREHVPVDEVGLNRAGYMARYASVKERLLELLIQKEQYIEALAVLESAKGRSLQDALAGFMGKDADSESPTQPSIENILADIPSTTAIIEYYIGRNQGWGFLIQSGKVEVFPILIQDRSDPRYGTPFPTKEIITLVRECLQRDLSGSVSSTRNPSRLPMPQQIQTPGYTRRWQTSLWKLRTSLLSDSVLDALRTARTETVLIIPHHILHYLPFAALVVERDDMRDDMNDNRRQIPQPKFLLDEPFIVHYAPSLTAWDMMRQRKVQPLNSITALGISRFSTAAPLPGIDADIVNIQQAFGKDKVITILENAVTKETVLEALHKQGLLLIGTHGVNNSLYPLNSFLLVRSGEGEDDDDFLTAEEIFRTHVDCDLVILSTCESGLAEKAPIPSDDLFGIQRALLRNGAGAVVSGLWDVYDVTGPMIIGDMMERLAGGCPVAPALVESQREFLRRARSETDKSFTHPYFWAVYTLNGNGHIVFH